MTTRVTMKQDREGYPDGLTLHSYVKGETYDLDDNLATAWLAEGAAVESKKRDANNDDHPQDPFTVNASPDPAVQEAHHDLEREQTEAEKLKVDDQRRGRGPGPKEVK